MIGKIKVLPIRQTLSFIKSLLPSFIFLVLFYLILYKIYIPYTNSFGCFDECMNIGGAYFMTRGKELYSEIFFNHQPFMAYLSYGIQLLTQPQNMYELLLRHTHFMLLFGFACNLFLLRRFGLAGLWFIIVFELTKFYLFGNRFLAESYIVYPFAYMTGLLWNKYYNKPLYRFDIILSAILAWFIIFMREPFTFAALFVLLAIVGVPRERYKKLALGIFLILSLVTILLQPLSEYFYSIIIVNTQSGLYKDLQSGYALIFTNIFFYPFHILIGGSFSEFWMLLVGLSIVFLVASFYLFFILKKRMFVIMLFILLGLSNIRYIPAGTSFFEAFHMIPWMGIFLFSIGLMITEFTRIREKHRYFRISLAVIAIVCFVAYLLHPRVFFKNSVDTAGEFLTNYGGTMQYGEIVRTLSTPQQTFFIDYTSDWSLNLMYWEAKRPSSYQYSWYTYFAPKFTKYQDARKEMLQKNPPDFYYADPHSVVDIDKETERFVNQNYTPIYIWKGREGVMYIKNDVYAAITPEKWEAVKHLSVEKSKKR